MRACAHSVEVLVGMRIVRSHASVHVVLGVRLVVLSVPLIVSTLCPNSHTVSVHPTLYP